MLWGWLWDSPMHLNRHCLGGNFKELQSKTPVLILPTWSVALWSTQRCYNKPEQRGAARSLLPHNGMPACTLFSWKSSRKWGTTWLCNASHTTQKCNGIAELQSATLMTWFPSACGPWKSIAAITRWWSLQWWQHHNATAVISLHIYIGHMLTSIND